jgi:hypothetical protein
MVEKSENNTAMDDNENYLEVRQRELSQSLVAALSGCSTCVTVCVVRLISWEMSDFARISMISFDFSSNLARLSATSNQSDCRLSFAALQDELFAVYDVVRQRECESVCEIHAESSDDTESGELGEDTSSSDHCFSVVSRCQTIPSDTTSNSAP